jgi:5-methyltetrahydropteroyltriglutamate--homocysteine methyltransferase
MSREGGADPNALADAARQAIRDRIKRQLECGIDIGNDGEQPRESFFTYVRYRMSGFGGQSPRPAVQDVVAFPTFAELFQPRADKSLLTSPPRCTGDVRYVDRTAIDCELDDYAKALSEQSGRFVESFWTAPSPGIIACAMHNDHYASLPDYVDAVAQALRTEYEAIAARGMVLQIDGPDLAMERHRLFAGRPLGEFLDFVDLTVAALNRALANVPPERVRLHVCWGNYEGPHVFDVPLEDLAPHLYAARVGGLVLSMANPRHAHEYRVLAKAQPPRHWAIVAGVIDTTTNYVEHPEVVADRIEQAARAIGDPHRVLAGTDCGFDTSTGLGKVAEEVVWEKLRALRAGAELATRRLM